MIVLNLNNDHLLASYKKALELELEKAFIELLEKELMKRGIVFSRFCEDKQESK
ncbi:sporulation histidine kinase inhibitor Sda [Paenibacillus piri]|uniref:Sporulation histidine kinase inhibitor Sda n=1 Tax=Paenibacillus piri TaxID=2547395 RepID=A0A4R5KJU6_9BACL|nr:sporulation histidine kinase inhibitor Sda [Paenibacillus piri]